MTVINEDLKSWGEFLEKIDNIRQAKPYSSNFLFRGLPDSNFSLQTTLERAKKGETSLLEYYHLISRVQPQVESFTNQKWDIPQPPEFGKQLDNVSTLRLQTAITADIYSYLIYLRHHGFPSPLLDWSHSPYIAAYFAFRCPVEPVSGKVSIYMFSEMPDGATIVMSSDKEYATEFGRYIRTHKRHFLQQCSYTLCAQYNVSQEAWYLSDHEKAFATNEIQTKEVCWKFTIPWSERMKVLRSLDDHNLNAFSLFGSEESLMETMAMRELSFQI